MSPAQYVKPIYSLSPDVRRELFGRPAKEAPKKWTDFVGKRPVKAESASWAPHVRQTTNREVNGNRTPDQSREINGNISPDQVTRGRRQDTSWRQQESWRNLTRGNEGRDGPSGS